VLAVLLAGFTLAAYLILRAVVLPTFEDVELAAAEKDLKRAEMAMRTDLDNLDSITADWAHWDEIYGYVRGENPSFASAVLRKPTLENLGLDFMAIYGLHGRIVWGQVLVDGAEIGIGELPARAGAPDSAGEPLMAEPPAARAAGVISTAFGPALISSRPVLRSDDSGPTVGSIVIGQFLDNDRLARLRERTGVELSWSFAADTPLADSAVGELVNEAGRTKVSSRKIVADVWGEPYLLLKVELPRQISALGKRTTDVALAGFGIVAILASVFVWYLLRGTIIRPIGQLASHMRAVRESGDLTRRLDNPHDDEIGALARQFDALTAEVHDTRLALLDQSFKAGKADTAAEVLHNIRNAMTPLINGLHRLGKSFRVAGRVRVDDALEQLRGTDVETDRKDKLLQYIDAAFRHVADTGRDALDDLGMVTSQARQIEGILTDQERFANAAPAAETIVVDDVVGEAAHVIPRDTQPPVVLDASPELARHRVKANRIRLLQVISNLILNAHEAIQRGGRQDGRIEVDAVEDIIEGRSMLRLCIRDNGCGFSPEIGSRIFDRGFSAKNAGETTGLGLHWCAGAVNGMGGNITAHSDGPGKGAEFHVVLPMAPRY